MRSIFSLPCSVHFRKSCLTRNRRSFAISSPMQKITLEKHLEIMREERDWWENTKKKVEVKWEKEIYQSNMLKLALYCNQMELASVKTQSEMAKGNLNLRTALEIITSVYRVQLGPRFFQVGVQGILNQITLGNLDYVSPIPYTDARNMAITILSPSIDSQATLVDDAMQHLYHKTLKYMHGAEADFFIIRQDDLDESSFVLSGQG